MRVGEMSPNRHGNGSFPTIGRNLPTNSGSFLVAPISVFPPILVPMLWYQDCTVEIFLPIRVSSRKVGYRARGEVKSVLRALP